MLEREDDVAGWRTAARALLAADVPADTILWQVAGSGGDLFGGGQAAMPLPPPVRDPAGLRIARDLIHLIETALLHSDADRFALAYRLVQRCQAAPDLWRNPADGDAARLAALAKAVRRDIHKMHAFVRFRKVGEGGRRERFAAWFEPDHHITRAVAGFFRNRFTGMDWLIVTPEASIAWDGRALSEGPGGTKGDVPGEDAIEAEWRAYYSHIFNPARLKVDAMRAEMPKKYWRNLPEASLIPHLIETAEARSADMVTRAQAQGAPLFENAGPAATQTGAADLPTLYAALAEADAEPRAGFGDWLVLGEGPVGAPILFVGEQPGDQEDRQGRPFVGPAGQMFDGALGEAGIARTDQFVTNAVKRFKFVPRGPRRIHQKPTSEDIAFYRPWLEEEVRLVAPRLVVALGATAAQALTGKPVTISRVRGAPIGWRDGLPLMVTVHPSYLLRLPDEAGARIEREKFVRDLATAREAAR